MCRLIFSELAVQKANSGLIPSKPSSILAFLDHFVKGLTILKTWTTLKWLSLSIAVMKYISFILLSRGNFDNSASVLNFFRALPTLLFQKNTAFLLVCVQTPNTVQNKNSFKNVHESQQALWAFSTYFTLAAFCSKPCCVVCIKKDTER